MQAPATLVVTLPAEAKLTIDDRATAAVSARRVFSTPQLPLGETFHYTLKAEVNGQVITRTVAVQGGKETLVSLDLPRSTEVASGQ